MAMTLAECIIYPLKAGAGLPREQVDVTALGLRDDRRWMLVQDSGKQRGRFISQRSPGCGKLALIQALPTAQSGVVFTAPGQSTLEVAPDQLVTRPESVEVWGTACAALDAGDNAADWFSAYLGMPCRLVKMDERTPRPTDPRYSQPGDRVSFADGMPLLVTTTASLDALNRRLGADAVGMDRFRPNLILDGALPFEEDVIHELRIGETVLELTLPCARCSVPNIDQQSGIAPGDEPTKTLIETRRGQTDELHGVFFGQNAIPRALGTLSVGAPVEVLSRRPMHTVLQQAALRFEAP